MAEREVVRVVEASTPHLRDEVVAVRWEVFVREQGVPVVLEIDARDMRADVVHLVALDATGTVLGTVRIIPDSPGRFHLGRLAVRRSARGSGVGAALVAAVHEHVRHLTPAGGTVRIVLDAQVRAMPFYARCGYAATTGEVFLDAGIEHEEMAVALTGLAS